jgi:hypothetical protein
MRDSQTEYKHLHRDQFYEMSAARKEHITRRFRTPNPMPIVEQAKVEREEIRKKVSFKQRLKDTARKIFRKQKAG